MVENIGPYRVYERLGVGGMGEVYKAYDDRLDRWVAIKRIRPDREDADDNRERFKREARATARLNHPSIVHLYGIFQDGDSDCIVMEYVEGKTLDQMLVDGPIEPLKVATLGHEIAAGLSEAHSSGILHRDLKAENIIITSRGRAKILDFGLAKPILRNELDPVLTGKGQLVGTSRAMSPEYVGGENIDHRSDLFSLGVLLYECLTGQSPFKAHNTLATLKQVMLHKQTPIRDLNPDVPKELSGLIDRLLEKEPDNRPQSAQEVAIAFGHISGQMSSGVFDAPGSTSTVSTSKTGLFSAASETVLDLRPRRRWITGLVLLAVLLGLAFWLGGSLLTDGIEPPEPLGEGEIVRVILGDLVNSTGEEVFGGGLSQVLRVSLEQSRNIRALSSSQVNEALARMQLPPETEVDRQVGVELARREGAERLVVGEIQKFGESYSLLVQVVEPETDDTAFSASETAKSQDEILQAIGDLASAVRRHLGESAAAIQQNSAPLEKVTTANFEALRAYSLASRRLASQEPGEEAITLLKRAVQLDPGFAMAHARLMATYSNVGETELAKQHAAAALLNAERLTEVERFYIDGWVARWQGTTADQIEVWSLMSDLHPESYSAQFNLGASLWLYRNDYSAAEEAFLRAEKVATGELELSQIRMILGFVRLAQGKLDGLQEELRAAGPFGLGALASLFASQRDYDSAFVAARKIERREARELVLGRIELDRGDLEASEVAFESAKQLTEGSFEPPGEEVWMNAVVGLVTLAAARNDRRSLRGLTDQALKFAKERGRDRIYSRSSRGIPIAPFLAVVGRTAVVEQEPEKARELRRLLGDPPDHAAGITLALIEVLDAELLISDGALEEAGRTLENSLARVETLIALDAVARLKVLEGDLEGATSLYESVSQRRGRSFVDCEHYCPGPATQLLINNLAIYELGRWAQELGNLQDAQEHLSSFLASWKAGRISAEWTDATERQSELEEELSK